MQSEKRSSFSLGVFDKENLGWGKRACNHSQTLLPHDAGGGPVNCIVQRETNRMRGSGGVQKDRAANQTNGWQGPLLKILSKIISRELNFLALKYGIKYLQVFKHHIKYMNFPACTLHKILPSSVLWVENDFFCLVTFASSSINNSGSIASAQSLKRSNRIFNAVQFA